MDFTPLIHALIAIAAQLLVGLLTGNWWLGSVVDWLVPVVASALLYLCLTPNPG